MTDFSPGYSVKFVGPFPGEHIVVVEGRHIPHLSISCAPDGSSAILSLDHRFVIDGTMEEMAKWCHFIANAMAVAAGFSHLGAEKKYEIFAPLCSEITPPRVPLRVVENAPPEDSAS